MGGSSSVNCKEFYQCVEMIETYLFFQLQSTRGLPPPTTMTGKLNMEILDGGPTKSSRC